MTAQPTLPTLPTLASAAAEARALATDLCRAFVERDDEVACLLTALVAEEHVLLLGDPGTGKSAITNAFAGALGGDTFTLLLTRYTVPEEVFGPVSLRGLEADEYRRVTTGYAPEAQVWFLDEIFKANSAILNSLLTGLNERVFDNGGRRGAIPLEICIGASNELPQDDGLGALFDRFVLRRWVSYVKNRDSLRGLLLGGSRPRVTARLSTEALQVLRAAREQVDVEPVIDALLDIKDELSQKHGITPSDRRWGKAIKLIQAQAVLAGRTVATGDDLLVLADALWDRPEDRAAIYGLIAAKANPDLHAALAVYDAAVEQFGRVPWSEQDDAAWTRVVGPIGRALREQVMKIRGLKQTPQVTELGDKAQVMLDKVVKANAARRDF
jgi:MoxR-like ATPase